MNLQANKVDTTPSAVSTNKVIANEYNQIAGSLMTLQNAAGITADANDNTQILQAVKTVVAPAEVTDLTSTSITLANAAANTVYKYGTLTSLTVSANDTSNLETLIYFTAGAGITVSLPNTLETIGDMNFGAGNKYVISILNNVAVLGVIE